MKNTTRAEDPRITVIQKELFDEQRSERQRYSDLVVGEPGLWPLLKFEAIVTLCAWMPGALGLFLRSRLYPRILGAAGRGVTFGVGVVLRHPRKIRLGNNVVIDDYCCLDAKGRDNRGIEIGSRAFISRNSVLTCKNGDIVIDEEANIGVNVEISSASRVTIGKKVLIAAYTYLVGGDHLHDRTDIPVLDQGRTTRGIIVDDHAWIGAHVVVTDGAHIGRDAIIGAGAVVVGDIPEFAIATGIPAKVVRDRRGDRPLMCGIAALAASDSTRPIAAADLEPMVAALLHRGPDDGGTVFKTGAALGMRRLSIIDVVHGHQPFANEDGSIVAIANGEIYNFEAVKRELQARGHVFQTRSDIEVVPHAYEEYGLSFVTRLHGMFAIALWDARTRTLVAARDRAGEKPLYYAETAQGLVIGSEIKAVLEAPGVDRRLDPVSLDQFLTYEYVIAPRTIFTGIRRLPAAHLLTYCEGVTTIERYWDGSAIPLRKWREDEAAQALRETLGRAVESQMMSDVPLGVFLSGGVDSSAIVAFMADAAHRNGSTVNSFSMGFEDGSYNELPYAREVANRFGTNHRERLVTPDVAALFDRLVVHFDEPFGDVSLFPTFMVSELARAHVTVALAGDGGDELFAGYDTYQAQAMAARIERLVPSAGLAALERLVSLFPPSEKKKGLVNKLRRFFQGITGRPEDIAQYRWMTFLTAGGKTGLYTPALQRAVSGSDVYAPVRDALGAGPDDVLNRQLYADLSIYLADDILTKVDRMSMATLLETRAPFLDVEVMELALSMPGHLKMQGGERKYILKRALQGLVPASVLYRKKEGFSIPMKQWLRRELSELMDDLLSPERVSRRGLFEAAEVSRLVREHRDGRENHAHTLFPLLVFERWAQAFLD